MNRSPGEAFSRLAQQLNRARQQASRAGGAGGGRGGGGAQGAATGGGLLMALVLGGLAVNASIYNVDGGHRAILYSRLGGIQDKIYGEGTHFKVTVLYSTLANRIRSPGSSTRSTTTSVPSRETSALLPAPRTCRW